jgi:hypothetical protein
MMGLKSVTETPPNLSRPSLELANLIISQTSFVENYVLVGAVMVPKAPRVS